MSQRIRSCDHQSLIVNVVDVVLALEVVRVLTLVVDALHLDRCVEELVLSAAHVGDARERLQRLHRHNVDAHGNLAGACTTSGMAYKLHGRVGDSPIIGAGLFVDNEVGAACATGVGEAIVRIAGSAIVVELMRQGKSPGEACKEAVDRIIAKHKDMTNMQVGFIALNKYGETGGYSVYAGFNYAKTTETMHEMVDAEHDRPWG